jgi:integrase
VDDLSREWIAYLEAERKPENTIKARARVLRSVGNAGTVTREELEGWWAGRRDLAPATRAQDLACLRAFYKWAQRWEKRLDDPTMRLDAPRVDRGLPRPVSRADLRHLLDELPDDLRRAVALGAYAGLRVSEVAALMWDDVDVEARRARIHHGKGGKSRVVAIGTVLIDHLLPERPGRNVVSGEVEAMTANALERKVNRAMKRLGVADTFHGLRHRYGTLAYQATRDLIAVGRQMGHSSPVTTAVYSAAADDVADEIAEAVTR